VQADHDVRHDLERCPGEVPERSLEIRDRPLEVVDLLDRILRADHVEHRGVDAGCLDALRGVARDERGVHRDPNAERRP
jgi:hypothetical protein